MARPPPLFDPDAAGGPFGRFFAGARAAFAGVTVVWSDRRLILWSLAPMLVHLVVFTALVAATMQIAIDNVAPALARFLGVDGFGIRAVFLRGILEMGVAVFDVVAAFVVGVLVASVVADPFYDAISERTEELYLGRTIGEPFTPRSITRGIARELGATAFRLALWGAVAGPLWLSSFTVAGVIAAPLSMVWTWLFAAHQFFSRSLMRHTVQVRDELRVLLANKAFLLGFGAVAALISILPLSSPFLVAGATRAYVALAARGRVASRLTVQEREHLMTWGIHGPLPCSRGHRS